jgi:streptogramin lyase
MRKVLFLFISVPVLFFSGCPSEPDAPQYPPNEFSEFKISISDTLLACEGVSFIDFIIQDFSSAYQRRADAFYQGEQVGHAFADRKYLDGTVGGTIHLNTLPLPENVRLMVVARNDLGYTDTIFINLHIIKRTGVEYFSTYHGGQLEGGFNAVKEGVKVPDGSVWIITSDGLLIINPDHSISTHEYNGYGQGESLQNIVSDNNGEARFIDSDGRILKWSGSEFELLGQMEIPYGHYLGEGEAILVEDEYFGIIDNSTGTILKYNLSADSTFVYNLINHICGAIALSKAPGNQILAAFSVSAENEERLFCFQNEQWEQIQMPVNNSPYGPGVIYCDSHDRLWFGFGSDLYQLTGSNYSLIQLPSSLHAPNLFECFNAGTITGICEDDNGDIWIARGSGGFIRYDHQTIYVYPGTIISEKFTSCSSEEPDVKQVFPGINGGIFVLTYGSPVGNVLKNFIKE